MKTDNISPKGLMKNLSRFIALMLWLPLLCASCSDKEEPEILVSISLTGEIQTFDAAGGEQTLNFNSTTTWTAATDQAWCTVSPANGPAGECSIAIHTEPNDGPDERKATVTLTSSTHDKISQQITIIQTERKDFGRILITHVNQLFKTPTLTGQDLKGSIFWGDTQQEEYKPGASHSYKNEGPHTVTLECWGAEEIVLSDITGVTELNLTDFSDK